MEEFLRAGRTYMLRVRSPRRLAEVEAMTAKKVGDRDWELLVRFEGPGDAYVRRDLAVPLI